MKKKILLVLSMILLGLTSITLVAGQIIPNEDHIFVVTIGMPETVDPHWAYDTASGELIQNIYEPLCIFDKNSSESFLPALADWWPGLNTNPGNAISPIKPGWNGSAETWLFRIRQNVLWQDPTYGYVTPEDVEYSFERGMLMDHTAGPMWMLYEPLLGVQSSYDYDEDLDGTLNETEYLKLDNDIDNAIQQNGTHVWFNLQSSYAPFQQILCQTWSMIMSKQWCIDHNLWNGQHSNYTEFLRVWDPPEPGPLMEQSDAPGPVIPGPVAMGSGPYKLVAMNPDPHTGWYTLEKFDDYWRGWPAPGYMFTDGEPAEGFAKYVTVKCVEEWTTRKAQFFSTDPALQADFCAVPRPNIPELHQGGNKDGPVLPGFRLIKYTMPILYAVYFTFDVNPTSAYVPKIGTTPKPDMFKDRYLRLAFMHSFNFSQFIEDVYLGEAEQSPVCMPAGTAFFNSSKPKYDMNISKATEYFQKAWGGEIWNNGMTVKIAYNIGNVMRQVTAEMLEYNIENLIPWPSGVSVNIEVEGVPWSVYLPGMRNQMYPLFIVGWLADFPDPHNWFMPFMHSAGTYAGRQNVTYGLDPASLYENWYSGATYGPPPYTNALGEKVTEINTTYVDHLIDTAVGQPPEIRQKLYEELMDIYYAEATQLPMCYTIVRHYERTWINGYDKTYNLNPINPGFYFYTIWKAWPTSPTVTTGLVAETILYGTSISISDSFIDPETGLGASSFLVFLQQSPDNETWTNIAASDTDENGAVYFTVTPSAGTTYYRINFTGYIIPSPTSKILNPHYYEKVIANQTLPQTLPSVVGRTFEVTTKTLDEFLTEKMASLQTMLYASIIIAIISLIVAITILLYSRK